MTEQVDAKKLSVKSEVQRIINEAGHQMGSTFIDELNKIIEDRVRLAIKRSADNGRKQVRDYDL